MFVFFDIVVSQNGWYHLVSCWLLNTTQKGRQSLFGERWLVRPAAGFGPWAVHMCFASLVYDVSTIPNRHPQNVPWERTCLRLAADLLLVV